MDQAETLYGPFYGMMGHSLGGLAASLAFEALQRPGRQRKLVLVAPAETETAIRSFFIDRAGGRKSTRGFQRADQRTYRSTPSAISRLAVW
jgi:pimeloyl-ACP methyl ester carboxylesterase